MSLKDKNIIIGVCGGIAAYKSCDLIRALVKSGANVECILTENGAKFITPLTLQTLSKNKVHTGMFDSLQEWDIGHISLASKADMIVIVPATADTISGLACGRAGNLLLSTVLASKAKILVCPAMNSNMFNHRATAGNINTLKTYGYGIVMPEKGELACGTVGDGRLASVDNIMAEIIKEFS